jgi:shikimate kinase
MKVFRFLGLESKLGAKVKVESNIPIGRGLKSSSAATNALALATTCALGKELDDITILNLGIDASIEANVTITGAFDDASASYFGGIVVTDNIQRKILKRDMLEEDYSVLFHVPERKVYAIQSNVQRIKTAAHLVNKAFDLALAGEYWAALSLNGLIYSSVLDLAPSIALDALMAGAIASGLSGTGPSVAAIASQEKIDSIIDAWQRYDGKILKAKISHQKAHANLGNDDD